MAFVVGHRTREIGLRMALGTRAADVAVLVLPQGLTPVLAGLLGGLLASLALARGLSALLFGVAPRDPLTLAAAVLGAVATLACAVPAARAARIRPAEALRRE